jgi:hypothetical protein
MSDKAYTTEGLQSQIQYESKDNHMNPNTNNSKLLPWLITLALAGVLAGCGGGGGNSSDPAAAAAAAQLTGAAGAAGGVCTGGAACVSIGTAGNLAAASGYTILTKTGVSSVPTSAVTGNIGVSPAARGALTGWSLISEATDTSFGSAQVAAPARLFAADNVGAPTSVNLTTAVGSMQTAYTNAAGMALAGGGLITACPGAGNFGGQILATGVYKCAVDVTIPTDVTLNGNATDVFVIEITGKLTQSNGMKVLLTGGAVPKNVFWQVSGVVTIGTTAVMQGVILAQTNIDVQTGATVTGRLLAQTAVTLDKATVTAP